MQLFTIFYPIFSPKVQSWSIRTGPNNIYGPAGPQFAKSDNTLESSHPTTQEYKAHCDRQRFANLWTNLNLTITLVQLMDYSIMLIQYFVEGNLDVSIKMKYGIFFNNCSHNSFQLEVRIDKVCLWDGKAGNSG